MIGRTALGREDAPHRVGIRRIGTQAVDGLGGKRDQPAAAQDRDRARDVFGRQGRSAHQQPHRLFVLLRGLRQHVRGQRRRGRLLVPGLRLEPVAHELLVEARRADAGAVLGRRPEARGVGRERFVDQIELAGGVGAELELGVGDDDAARARRSRRLRCRARMRHLAHLRGARRRRAAVSTSSKEMFSSCVPAGALVDGVKIGSGQFLAPPAGRPAA